MSSLKSDRRMLQNAAEAIRQRLRQASVPPPQIEEALRRFFTGPEFDRAADQYALRVTPAPVLEFPLDFTPDGDPVGVDLSQDVETLDISLPHVGVRDATKSGVVSARLQPGYFNRGWSEMELQQWLPGQEQYRGAGLGACKSFHEARASRDDRNCFFPDPPEGRWFDPVKNEVVFPALKKDGSIAFFEIKKKMRRNDLVVLRIAS